VMRTGRDRLEIRRGRSMSGWKWRMKSRRISTRSAPRDLAFAMSVSISSIVVETSGAQISVILSLLFLKKWQRLSLSLSLLKVWSLSLYVRVRKESKSVSALCPYQPLCSLSTGSPNFPSCISGSFKSLTLDLYRSFSGVF
jgi:hypothetical protein